MLEESLRESSGDGAAFDLFFLAMCHARLGDVSKARSCYDRAVKWLQERQGRLPADEREELTAFRAEAGALLTKPEGP